jgi:hypothetical protein
MVGPGRRFSNFPSFRNLLRTAFEGSFRDARFAAKGIELEVSSFRHSSLETSAAWASANSERV